MRSGGEAGDASVSLRRKRKYTIKQSFCVLSRRRTPSREKDALPVAHAIFRPRPQYPFCVLASIICFSARGGSAIRNVEKFISQFRCDPVCDAGATRPPPAANWKTRAAVGWHSNRFAFLHSHARAHLTLARSRGQLFAAQTLLLRSQKRAGRRRLMNARLCARVPVLDTLFTATARTQSANSLCRAGRSFMLSCAFALVCPFALGANRRASSANFD